MKGEIETYEFTAPATGMYKIYTSVRWYQQLFYNGKFLESNSKGLYKLTKGKTYHVEIGFAGGMSRNDKVPKFEICKITKKTIALDKKVKAKEGVFYRFTPKETGLYLIDGGTYIKPQGGDLISAFTPRVYGNPKNATSHAIFHGARAYKLQKGKTYDILVSYFLPKNSTLSIKKTKIVKKDKIQYIQLADETWAVIDIDKSVKKANIAGKISGKDVTVISLDNATYDHNLTEINIPASVTTISICGNFLNPNLEKINIAKGSKLEAIINYDRGPGFLSATKWEKKQKGMVYLGNIAFNYYGKMKKNTTVKLKYGTKTIGSGALSNDNLSGVEIPYGVTTIESYAICIKNIKSLYVPSSVKTIDETAFGSLYSVPKDFVLTGQKGSYVEKYAKEYNIKFKAVSCKKHKFVKDGNKQICTVCGKKK